MSLPLTIGIGNITVGDLNLFALQGFSVARHLCLGNSCPSLPRLRRRSAGQEPQPESTCTGIQAGISWANGSVGDS